MSAIRKVVQDLFTSGAPAPRNIPVSKLQIIKNEPIPLDIYQDLDDVGEDREKVMTMIAESFKDNGMFPQSGIRHNRRQLYKSIHFLRTGSKRKWMLDVMVERGEYTTDRLVKRVQEQHPSLLKPVH